MYVVLLLWVNFTVNFAVGVCCLTIASNEREVCAGILKVYVESICTQLEHQTEALLIVL